MEYQNKLRDLGITLTHNGKQICPKCSNSRKNKTDPCLSVTYSDSGVLYKCHNCDWSGIVYYRDKYESKKSYKRPDPPKTINKIDVLYQYFKKRGISKQTVDKYSISYNSKNEIVIPYYKYGELVNVKYRKNIGNGKKTFRQEPETEKTLFGMDLVETDTALIWVEGEMDVLALAEQGIYAVSVPQGASETKLECIENCFEFIEQFNTHIIAVDNDIPGDKLKLNLLSRLGKDKCKIVNWKRYKDANEALMGGEKLKDFIDTAENINPDGVSTFLDNFDEIYRYNYEKDRDYYETSWNQFNQIVRLRTGYLMVVTGYPSRGKSTFVDNLLIDLSKKYDLRHLIASFESTTAIHYNTLAEMYNQDTIYHLIQEGKLLNDDTLGFLSEHFYRFDINKRWSVSEICERTKLAAKKYGIKTLVIDPYNRLNNNFNDREDLYIGKILSELSMLAKALDILVIFVAHPKKPDGEKIPNLYNISGSSDWYNMSDYGIIVHRERNSDGKLSDLPQIFVQKVKNFFLGKPSGGIMTLLYDKNKRILKNV